MTPLAEPTASDDLVEVLGRQMPYKWVVAIVYVAAIFLDILDTTIVNVALFSMGKEFHTDAIEWVVLGYTLSLAVWIPTSGWLGDRFGTKKVFLFALTAFALGSFACGMSQSIGQLIAFRVLQGVGGGMLTPVGVSMLFRAFPHSERAKASTVIMMPTLLRQFELRSEIASGGMGTVYRAFDTVLEREVAVKLMKKEIEEDPKGLENFYREARACASLNHTNIVQIYSYDELDGLRFLVMELADRGNLDSRIEKYKRLPELDVLDIGIEWVPATSDEELFNGRDLTGWFGKNPHSVDKLTGDAGDERLAVYDAYKAVSPEDQAKYRREAGLAPMAAAP